MTTNPENPDDANILARGWPYLALLVLTGAVYWRAPELGFMYGWDDQLYVVARPEVQDWFGVSWSQRLLTPEIGYPVPVPTFVYYLLGTLPGATLVPAGHLVNLLVHVCNVVLVYRLARRWLDGGLPALAAASLWASHPLLVETVAWLTNLKTLLSTLFILAALAIAERYRERPSTGRAVAIGLCVAGALGCRPDGVVAAVLLLGGLYLRRRGAFDRLRTRVFAGAVLAVSALYLAVAFIGRFAIFAQKNVGDVPDLGFVERLTRMGAAFSLQVRHVVVPTGLHPSYSPEAMALQREASIGAVLFVALVAATVVSIRRVPRSRWGWAIWWAFYLPASGILFLPRFTADTYLYLPLIGLMLAGTAIARRLLAGQRIRVRRVAAGATIVLVATLALRAHTQTLRWRNRLTLWMPVVEQRPDAVRPNWMVASAYVDAGEYDRALEHYERVYEGIARHGRIPLKMAEAYAKVGEYRRAAEVAADIFAYPGVKPSGAPAFLLQVAVEQDLAIDPDSRVGRALQSAAQTLLERATAGSKPTTPVLLETARYLARRGWRDLGRRYAAVVLRRDPETCPAWEILDALESKPPVELPARPESCP